MRDLTVRVLLPVLLWMSAAFPRPPARHAAHYWDGGPSCVRRPDEETATPAEPPAAQGADEDPEPVLVRPYVLRALAAREEARATDEAAREAAWQRIQEQLRAECSERLARRRRRVALAVAEYGQDRPEPLHVAAAYA